MSPTGDDLAVTLTSDPVPFTVTQLQAAEAAAAARAMWATPLTLTDGTDQYALAPADIQAAITFGTTEDESYGVILNQTVLGTAMDQLAGDHPPRSGQRLVRVQRHRADERGGRGAGARPERGRHPELGDPGAPAPGARHSRPYRRPWPDRSWSPA